MIAAPGSGSGKTTFTTGLLAALTARGERVYAYKCGPDYIDPMYHVAAMKAGLSHRKEAAADTETEKEGTGSDHGKENGSVGIYCVTVSSRNLDTFFTDDDMTRHLYLEDPDEGYHIVEGVMGLYDGVAGTEVKGSSYDLARVLKLPILLIVNARGQGRSLIALLKGFKALDREDLIRGVFLNQTTESMYLRLAPLIEEETGLRCLGYLPKEKKLEAPSRHLGLLAPGELPEEYLQAAEVSVEEHLDWENFFRITDMAERPETCGAYGKETPASSESNMSDPADLHGVGISKSGTDRESAGSNTGAKTHLRLAVARDEAFSFCYADNLSMLERAGAELVFFSPLTDPHLPEGIDGLLLSGGYPELFARQLSENLSMLQEIRTAVSGGLPTVAECGGFLYLQKDLEGSDGRIYPMAGVLSGSARGEGRLVRFGYVMIREKRSAFLPEGTMCKGHEFHYYDSTENGASCQVEKPVTGRSWEAVFTTETLWAGFPHVYYPACPVFAETIVSKMRMHYERKVRS